MCLGPEERFRALTERTSSFRPSLLSFLPFLSLSSSSSSQSLHSIPPCLLHHVRCAPVLQPLPEAGLLRLCQPGTLAFPIPYLDLVPANHLQASKVAVLGAGGGIGQPLSLLMKLNPRVTDLALYDIKGGPGTIMPIVRSADGY